MLSSISDPLQLKLMDIHNRQYVLDPTRHQREIFDLFGPVSIFKAGDYYPEFEYTLLEYMPPRRHVIEGDEGSGVVRRYGARVSVSGVIVIDSQTPVDPHLVDSIEGRIMFDNEYPNLPDDAVVPVDIEDEFLNKPLLLVGGRVPDIARITKTVPPEAAATQLDEVSILNPDVIRKLSRLDLPNFFRFSDIATSDWCRARVDEYLEPFAEPKRRPIIKSTFTVKSLLEYLSRKSSITQQQLFAAGGPGVYYNFVCRVRTNGNRGIKQRIAEAEGHRKSLVRAKFGSNGGSKGTRRKGTRRKGTRHKGSRRL